jgi:hypothetical protein
MSTYSFTIGFDYLLEGLSKSIHLKAVATVHHSEMHYVVSTITAYSDKAVLPDFDIKKQKGKWVHTDSEKETHLSKAAGEAIDMVLSAQADAKAK